MCPGCRTGGDMIESQALLTFSRPLLLRLLCAQISDFGDPLIGFACSCDFASPDQGQVLRRGADDRLLSQMAGRSRVMRWMETRGLIGAHQSGT